jgi:predicted dehydrogenase
MTAPDTGEGPAGRPFRVGFIASPHPHAAMHLKTLEVLPQVEAVRCAGVAGADGAAFAAEISKGRPVDSAEALLAGGDVDALLVCVRNDLAPALLDAAVDAGLPVIFEKPGALLAADLRRIARRAGERGLTFGTFLQWRGHPVIQEVRQAVADGALGRVMAVEGRMVTSQVRYRDPGHWLFQRETAGSGILSWLGCHYLDALCFMLDDRVTEVAAFVGHQNPEPIDVEDTAGLVLRYAGGALGTLHAGYLLRGSNAGYAGATYDTFLGLRGQLGYARLPLSEGTAYTLFSEAPGWRAGGRRERRFDPPPSPAYGGASGEEFLHQFLLAAREGRPALAPIEAAVHVLEIVEGALSSSAGGRAVRL